MKLQTDNLRMAMDVISGNVMPKPETKSEEAWKVKTLFVSLCCPNRLHRL